jgi:zinc transport system substrate-binding protein
VHSRLPPEDFHGQGEVDGSVDVEKRSVLRSHRGLSRKIVTGSLRSCAPVARAAMKQYNIPKPEADAMPHPNGPPTRVAAALAALAAFFSSPAVAEIDVVASIKPVHSLVAGVMRGVGEPTLLVKGTGSEHSYSLRPSEARALQNADVVVWVGETLETFLLKPLQALSGDAEVVELGKAPGLTLLPARVAGMWQATDRGDDHADSDVRHGAGARGAAPEDAGAHADEHQSGASDAGHGAAAEHAPGETEMHIWLDPANARAIAAAVASALGAADPDNAAAYQANSARLQRALDELDRSLEHRLASVAGRPYVVFHDAYQYFERRYGLSAVGAITINPTVRPSAGRLQEIQGRLEELGVACVFAEPQFEPTLVDTVIEGTTIEKGVLDPLGAALEPGPEQYFQLMDGLAASLTDCLGGPE